MTICETWGRQNKLSNILEPQTVGKSTEGDEFEENQRQWGVTLSIPLPPLPFRTSNLRTVPPTIQAILYGE